MVELILFVTSCNLSARESRNSHPSWLELSSARYLTERHLLGVSENRLTPPRINAALDELQRKAPRSPLRSRRGKNWRTQHSHIDAYEMTGPTMLEQQGDSKVEGVKKTSLFGRMKSIENHFHSGETRFLIDRSRSITM